MGAKHPQEVVRRLGAQLPDFILAATYLKRKGYVKSASDAIRYMDEHNLNVADIVEKIIESKRIKPLEDKQEEHE